MTQSNLDRAAIAIAQRVESAINRAANPTPVPDTIKTEVVKALEEAGFEQKMGNLQTILLAMQATLEQIKAEKGTGGATRPVTPAPAAPPAQPEPPQPTEPPAPVKPLVRSLNFFGDSTNARLGDQAINLAKADNLPVINNAAGGSLASYALMSMNGSPVEIKFEVDTIPAKGRNVTVDAEIIYGEGVTPFSMHSTIVMIGDDIEASIVGQTANVKVYPRDETPHSIVAGKKYPLKLKANGGTDGICVLATGKNDVNGANWSNWQAALERVKGYIQKCIALVQPKDTPRYIVLPIWADNKAEWSKEEHP